jgi:hypothetical protein
MSWTAITPARAASNAKGARTACHRIVPALSKKIDAHRIANG